MKTNSAAEQLKSESHEKLDRLMFRNLNIIFKFPIEIKILLVSQIGLSLSKKANYKFCQKFKEP